MPVSNGRKQAGILRDPNEGLPGPPIGGNLIGPATQADLYKPLPNTRFPVGQGTGEKNVSNPFKGWPRPNTP